MQNQATKWLAEYIEQNQLSAEKAAKDLQISVEKLHASTKQALDADEFLRLCIYLHIRPEEIPMD